MNAVQELRVIITRLSTKGLYNVWSWKLPDLCDTRYSEVVAIQIFIFKSRRFFEFDVSRFPTCLTVVFLTWRLYTLHVFGFYIYCMSMNLAIFSSCINCAVQCSLHNEQPKVLKVELRLNHVKYLQTTYRHIEIFLHWVNI